MENKPSLLQHTMSWGAITGIVLIIYLLILYVTNQTYNPTLGYLQYAFLCAGILIGSFAYRNKVLGGTISYGNAFIVGLLITIFAGILATFFSFILVRFIDPGLVEQGVAKTEEKLMNAGTLTEDQIDLVIERTRKFIDSPITVLVGIVFYGLIGTVLSLITAAIVKKEGNTFDRDTQSA
jgi:hypothetical protein